VNWSSTSGIWSNLHFHHFPATDPHFLDIGTSWRWVVSFTPRPLYPRGKSPRYPLDRRLGGPQPVWTILRRENSWPPPGLELRSLGHPARSLSLYRLLYPGSRRAQFLAQSPGKPWIEAPQCHEVNNFCNLNKFLRRKQHSVGNSGFAMYKAIAMSYLWIQFTRYQTSHFTVMDDSLSV
jgi:hypothetical protein